MFPPGSIRRTMLSPKSATKMFPFVSRVTAIGRRLLDKAGIVPDIPPATVVIVSVGFTSPATKGANTQSAKQACTRKFRQIALATTKDERLYTPLIRTARSGRSFLRREGG